MATIQLYADKINRMQGLIKETKQTVTVYRAELLTLKTKMLTINKSVCDLGDITASIQASSQIQEEKITSLNTFHKDCEDFISEVVRIDHDVADRIHTRKEEFYAQYYYLKPEYEKTWLEVIKDWFTAVREWCRQKWKLQAEEREVRCVRMYKEAVVFLTVGVLGQKQVKEGEMPRYLKEFLKQLRTNPDRIIMNAEQIKKYEELKRWPGWWGKEGGSGVVNDVVVGDSETERMMDNLRNSDLNISERKQMTIYAVGEVLLEQGFEPAFVAGVLANIIHEGEVGLFESSNYKSNPSNKPQYFIYMDQYYDYINEYSGQSIMDKKLSDVYKLLEDLEKENWQGGFGLGCVQWTYTRTKTLVEVYMEVASPNDKITPEQAMVAEGIMISRELSGEYGNTYAYIYSDWKETNNNLDSIEAASNAGVVLCKEYERPKADSSKMRGETAKQIYEEMMGD